MDLAALRTRVLTDHGFDVAESRVDVYLNDRYRELVSASKWNQATFVIGSTVAGTGAYNLPENVVDLMTLTVGTSGYERVGWADYIKLVTGEYSAWPRKGVAGVFSPQFSGAGTHQVSIWPTPDTASLTILGYGALLPTALTLATDVPTVPEDIQPAIAYGAIADLLMLDDERFDAASAFEARYRAGVERLARRRNSRIGSGSVKIKVLP